MSEYKICSRCIMDSSDTEIYFDANGVCNNCKGYFEQAAVRLLPADKASNKLQEIVEAIKISGKGKAYDCIIGVSGGVDSTYVAYRVKELGLRPLAVHFDNGWNSELAVSNIRKTLQVLGIELYTYVVDWEEFRDIQLSFLQASTPDGEIPSDHAILTILYRIAAKHNIKYILSGSNFKNEGILPLSWAYGHIDSIYIKAVHAKFGHTKIKTFPYMSLMGFVYKTFIQRIKIVSVLNYMDFNKQEAMTLLQEKLGWQYYGGKHYESVYTRFYQAYILPRKFGIDKRRAHLSTQICSGEIDRNTALEEMKKDIYPPDKLMSDKEYVIKKLELTEQAFEEIMKAPVKSYNDYPNTASFIRILRNAHKKLRKKGIVHN